VNDQDDALDEVVREFLVESAENLDQLDRDLVSLERDPGSRELLANVFRAVHTIKGTTGFLGFSRLEAVAHRAESLLSKLRDGALQLDSSRTTALLEVMDAIRALLAHIEAHGNDEDGRDHTELLARLSALQQPDAPDPAPAPVVAPVPSEPLASEAAAGPGPAPCQGTAESTAAAAAKPVRRRARAKPGAPAATPSTEPQAEAPATASGDAAGAQGPRPEGAPVAASAPAAPEASAQEAPAGVSISVAERTVRVDVDLLDTLMRQVGELVLARNQLISHAGELADGGRTLQRLSLIVSELQEDVMKTRMQPVEHLFSKLPRVVRDLANQFSKQVTLSMEGGETELDRSVLEAVKDPFTHLVRNALDHGIETPAEREALGKPRTGSLHLSAFHQGGKVVLEMTDDGAGIDPQRVGAKAVQVGLVTQERLLQMSTREITELVFQPGFSTAKQVSNISGRGVGMDVVRTNIERIGGSVDLISSPGAGTTVRVKIPLTLAIIPALLVSCRGAGYAVPQAAIQELVRLEGAALGSQVERVDGALLYRLRGRLLPLLRLDETLGYVAAPLSELKALDIVVVQADGEPFGLAVDAVQGTQEIVVKPLARQLKNLYAYAGATILGDGSVALILDVAGLAGSAGVSEGRVAAAAAQLQEAQGTVNRKTEPLLLLRVGDDRRVAVPLGQVARLEELHKDQVEHAGNRWALQYRGQLLPLAWLSEVLGVPATENDSGRLPVVVCSDGARSVGLVADQVVDVVEEVVNVSTIGAAPGVLGTAVVQGRATDFLDLAVAAELAGVPFRRTVDLSLGAPLDAGPGAYVHEEVGADAR
jgi:two-component system chemotaxis sensor kinase CheA